MLPRHVVVPAEIAALGPKLDAVVLPPPPRVVEVLVYAAAELIAGSAGSAERLSAGHRPRPDGKCAGHESCPRPDWPCFAVQVAAVAVRIRTKGW